MSVITYHEVSGNNIFDRLKAEGVIYEGDIYSPKRHSFVHFQDIFDMSKCNEQTRQEYAMAQQKRDALFEKEVRGNTDLTKEEQDYRIAENQKCDPMLMPVNRTKDGGVAWMLNHFSNDWPSVAIGRRYPDEIFGYHQSTEGHVDASCLFKADKDVTSDGVPYEDMLPHISSKQVQEVDERMACVSLYVDSSDKKPARFYCPKSDIRPSDYVYDDGYCDVVVRDKNKPWTLYRTLSDGAKSKESWSFDDVSKAVDKTKHEYRVKMAEKHSHGLQSGVESQSEFES